MTKQRELMRIEVIIGLLSKAEILLDKSSYDELANKVEVISDELEKMAHELADEINRD